MLPFSGADIWNHYEVSWLNAKGKPQVATAEIIYGCESPCIIESKSMKLYFNTLNNTRFADIELVRKIVEDDISKGVGLQAQVTLTALDENENATLQGLSGQSIDGQDIEIAAFELDKNLLTTSDEHVEEILYSNLLKSNCLVMYRIASVLDAESRHHAGRDVNNRSLTSTASAAAPAPDRACRWS